MALNRLLCVCCLVLLAIPAGAIEESQITDATENRQVGPLQILTNSSFLTAAQVGIGIAVELNPETKAVKEFADFTAIVMDEAVKAADFRNQVVESHLLLVSAEAKKLQEIRARDGNLKSDEAQAILTDLHGGRFSQDSTNMFLAKSVFSLRMVYGVASQYALDKAVDKIVGEGPTRSGERVELMWIGKRSFVRTHTHIRWRYLTVMGEASRKLTDAFQSVVLKQIGQRIGRMAVESTLDAAVDEILKDHPSVPEAAAYLRLNAMVQPQTLVLQARAPAMLQVVMPAHLEVQRDPVVRAANVQRQVIEEQHYQVSSGGESSTYREPVESHPTHSVPSITMSPNSFDGGSGSTLYSRW